MAVIKRRTRKKLTKQLSKLVKRHGAEMALALVTGIISSLAADRADKEMRKADRVERVVPVRTASKRTVVASPRPVRRTAPARKRTRPPM